MPKYIGWIPTVVGRLSFSRAADTYRRARTICNNTATPNGDGFLFGLETRTSRDGPLWPWAQRVLGRLPDVEYLLFLKVAAAELPCPASTDPPVAHETDTEGALEGEVFFFSKGGYLPPSVNAVCEEIKALATASRSPNCRRTEKSANLQRANQQAHTLWQSLVNGFRAGERTAAFGRGEVRLLRSGQCTVLVDPADLFSTRQMKQYHLGQGEISAADIEGACSSAARQIFFFMRDLLHRHYHHDPKSDLINTVYLWEPNDDFGWRRETQYGLARMIIAARRRDVSEAYKQAIGLLAYAEAFQRHLGGWMLTPEGGAVRSPSAFAYDFAALRLSIDASLKVRELKDQQRLQRWLFVFGFTITVLGLILSQQRSFPADPGSIFVKISEFVATHPARSLVAAAVLAFTVNLIFTSHAARPFGLTWFDGMARARDALQASVFGRLRRRWWAHIFTILVGAVLSAGFLGAACLTYWLAIQIWRAR